MTPTPVFQRSPRTPKKRPGRALGPSEACKSCVSCRILVVPADSLISTLLKYHAVFGEGGNTPTRVIPTDLLVSFPLSPCSSLWGRGQNTHARHIRRSSCQFPVSPPCSSLWGRGQLTHARHTNRSSGQFPAFPLLKPLGKGAKHPRASHQQVFLSISCFPPAQFIPLRILGCGGPA